MLQPTPEQQAVIDHEDGHAIVSAVAGSGKSATLIERIAQLMNRGVRRANCLVLMFNKSAQEAFARRLHERLPEIEPPAVMTFHGYGMQVCRDLHAHGVLAQAQLMTDLSECHALARAALRAAVGQRRESAAVDLGPELLDEFLETVDLLKAGVFAGGALPEGMPPVSPLFLQGFEIFERMRNKQGVRLFTDLIYDPVRQAERHGHARKLLQADYRHIIIDEFQDINDLQMRLVQRVAGPNSRIMAVGDEDQTIYVWRGARPDWMLQRFEKTFEPVTRYSLSRTFRFGHSLSFLANCCIRHNVERQDKLCVSATDQPTDIGIRMHGASEGADEGVVEEIKQWLQAGRRLSECAILVREFAHTTGLELALHENGLPCRVLGAAPFAARPEVLAVRAYLALCVNTPPTADQVRALLTVPPVYMRRQELGALPYTVSDSFKHPAQVLMDALHAPPTASKDFVSERRVDRARVVGWAANHDADSAAAPFLEQLFRQLKLFTHVGKRTSSPLRAAEKLRLLQGLVRLSQTRNLSVGALKSLLDQLSSPVEDEQEAITITSVHRAKGLEWPLVVLPDLAEGAFPGINPDVRMEDERRLFYVAITRAREQLLMCCPNDPQLVRFSQAGHTLMPPASTLKASRFVYEAQVQWVLNLAKLLEANFAKEDALPEGVGPLYRRYSDALAR